MAGAAINRAAVAGALLGAAAVAYAGPGVTALGPVRQRLFPDLAGLGHPGHVALTFDDGPDPASTPRFLELLARHGVRATFFLLGDMVMRAPGLAAQIALAGHEIGVHGFHHAYTVLRGPRATRDDLARAVEVISVASRVTPRWYRPPYGVLSSAALSAAQRLGLTPVLWSCWGREWAPGATADSVYRTVTARLEGGGTILLHDSDCTSPSGAAHAALGALPRLLAECGRRGLEVGPLAEHRG